MALIKDIMKPGREILEGKSQGVIQSHKANSEETRLESNAQKRILIVNELMKFSIIL